MTLSRLILRGLAHYWRTHLGVLLGTALAAMVLTGSLLTGDSIKATLRHQGELRVGRADTALLGGERFFRTALAGEKGAPVLSLRATATTMDRTARANAIQLLGVTDAFWALSPAARPIPLAADEAALNHRLATQLGAKPGDIITLRMEKPGLFSKDAPLSGEADGFIPLRVKVARVLDDADFGRFALHASQVPPHTAIVSHAALAAAVGLEGKANLVLFPQGEKAAPITLADLALEFRDVPAGGFELRSSRVFLDPPVVAAAPHGAELRRVDALTYFVNELRAGQRATPYSMVAAVEAPASGFLPAELADDEIAITRWLADDLRVAEGATVTLKYNVATETRELVEKTREFKVFAILPDGPLVDTSWMPDFPGLHDAQNCRDWKPGFAMDLTKMRSKDQDYWEKFRGTPKAFVNLRVGQEMWHNRWGAHTALRWPAGTDRAAIERGLLAALDPAALGIQTVPFRARADEATNAPVDFGQLFLGFSFFLIAAAAVLTGLLFVFSIEQRASEAGLLLALGLRPKTARLVFIAEGLVIAVVGALLGTALAVGYTRLVLHALGSIWRGATGTTDYVFHPTALSLTIGPLAAVGVAFGVMWLVTRRIFKTTARELMAGGAMMAEVPMMTTICQPRKSKLFGICDFGPTTFIGKIEILMPIIIGLGFLVLFGGMISRSPVGPFCLGAGVLAYALFATYRWLARRTVLFTSSATNLARRNVTLRRGRSMAIVSILASGVFMVIAVSAFRQRPVEDYRRTDTGTGGFALVGESAAPIYEDLNSQKGRETYGLDDRLMAGVRVVQMRVREGDDASCLNLNKAVSPRIASYRAADLTRDGKLRFGMKPTRADAPAEPVGIADGNTLQWALKFNPKSGPWTARDEQGRDFTFSIDAAPSASLLQGMLLIPEPLFREKFPNSAGYRFFLVDAPRDKIQAVREHLARQLEDAGLELAPTATRLAEFQAVENTYLSIFQVLGGLGLLLASVGLAVVIARNVLERRREFALLEAVGWRRAQIRKLVFIEHADLIFSGILNGAFGALFATISIMLGDQSPWRESLVLLAALILGCLFWAWLATRLSLHTARISALREE